MIDILEELNIKIDDLVESGMELYIGDKKEKNIIREKLKNLIISSLKNPNVYLLILAAYLLDKEGKNNNLPIDYNSDPNYIYVDEVIGIAIANEIAGTKAIFNFRFYDKHKPGVIGRLDKEGFLFMDDAIAGLLAGCMSKVFEYL